MIESVLTVREIEESDIGLVVAYWLDSDQSHFPQMGVDMNKLPIREEFTAALANQIQTPVEQKKAYCLIWEIDGVPTGHSNTNPIVFGEEACLHLHLWDASVRKKGMGAELLKMTLPYFFERLKLKKIYCEPYALNPAPNKTLEKLGFELVREYITIPGSAAFEQPVKRWELSYEQFKKLK